MKALWILAIAAAPLATLTVGGFLGASPDGRQALTTPDAVDAPSARALAEKKTAGIKAPKGVAAALIDADPLSPANLASLETLAPDGPLGGLRRTWPTWATARSVADELLGLSAADAQGDVDHLRAAKGRWEAFQQKLDAAKLPASPALAALVDQRVGGLQQQIARLESQAEAAAAAELVNDAFRAGQFDQCLGRSREWLTKYSGSAEASLTGEIKALGFRAEYQAERNRSRAHLKAAASPAEREAVLAAFLARFSKAEGLAASDRAVLEQCRSHLETLRAEAAARQKVLAAEEAVRSGMAGLPARFDERTARAARILQQHPGDSVKATLRSRAVGWLEESLPEKRLEESPDLREAQTKNGRILRGFFREVPGPDGPVGYKRYDTLAQWENPTADVGTWRSEDLASAPAPSVPQRLVQRYHDARTRLLQQPGRRELWEAFAAFCERLQAECDEYHAKPGAGEEPLGFRAEAGFARQVLSGAALRDLQIVWEGSKER